MIREFKNVNGITYEIIAENTELDRTLLREWTNNDTPLYIVAWGINYQRHYWAQGHYFLDDFKAACNYLNGEENKTASPDHYVSIKDFIRTLSKDTQIAIYNISENEWVIGCLCAYDTVDMGNWSDLPDDMFVDNVELHHDPDAGDGLWIDVACL